MSESIAPKESMPPVSIESIIESIPPMSREPDSYVIKQKLENFEGNFEVVEILELDKGIYSTETTKKMNIQMPWDPDKLENDNYVFNPPPSNLIGANDIAKLIRGMCKKYKQFVAFDREALHRLLDEIYYSTHDSEGRSTKPPSPARKSESMIRALLSNPLVGDLGLAISQKLAPPPERDDAPFSGRVISVLHHNTKHGDIVDSSLKVLCERGYIEEKKIELGGCATNSRRFNRDSIMPENRRNMDIAMQLSSAVDPSEDENFNEIERNTADRVAEMYASIQKPRKVNGGKKAPANPAVLYIYSPTTILFIPDKLKRDSGK